MKIPPEGPTRKRAGDKPATPDEAMRLLHEGQYKSALKISERLISDHPEDAVGWRFLAMSRLALGRAQEALDALTRTLELHQKHGSALDDANRANVHATRALIHLQQDNPLSADEDTRAALKLHPDDPDALFVATVTAAEAERLADAQRFASRLVKLDPDSAEARAWLARILSARGKRREAAEQAAKARELGFTTTELKAIEKEAGE